MNIWKLFRGLSDKNYRHFSAFKVEGLALFDSTMNLDAKLAMVLSNPAMLKVIALQCDLFSLGKFYIYRDGKEVEEHALLDLLNNPNPFQNSQEFLWEWMFWQMLGVSHVYIEDKDYNKLKGINIYPLSTNRVEFPDDLIQQSDKIILTQQSLKRYNDHKVTYRYNDGTNFTFDYGNLVTVSDLGHVNSRLSFRSKIDALIKVITNNEVTLDSMNINLRYSGKFMVAGMADPNDVTKLPLSEPEKRDIEKKALNDKPVEAVKSLIDIKRFVSDAAAQKLDAVYLHTYFVLGTMYNIPRDVLEAYNSATYENQEKARGAHIDYCLQPKGDLLTGKLTSFFGLEGEEIVLSWDHLSFMQVFEEQRANVQNKKANTLILLLRAGVPIEEINEFLDTNFTTDESKQKLGGTNDGQQENQGQGQENT